VGLLTKLVYGQNVTKVMNYRISAQSIISKIKLHFQLEEIRGKTLLLAQLQSACSAVGLLHRALFRKSHNNLSTTQQIVLCSTTKEKKKLAPSEMVRPYRILFRRAQHKRRALDWLIIANFFLCLICVTTAFSSERTVSKVMSVLHVILCGSTWILKLLLYNS
jgi:hypothetical protein